MVFAPAGQRAVAPQCGRLVENEVTSARRRRHGGDPVSDVLEDLQGLRRCGGTFHHHAILQKDVGAAQSLCAASGKASARDLGPGYLHWTSYYCTGASGLSQQRKLQSAFGRLEKEDKKVVGWLQDLTDDVLLYYVEKLVSPAMRTRVAREWQRHELASEKAQPSGGGAQKTTQ